MESSQQCLSTVVASSPYLQQLPQYSGIHHALVGNLVSQLKFSSLYQYVFASVPTCSARARVDRLTITCSSRCIAIAKAVVLATQLNDLFAEKTMSCSSANAAVG